VKPEDIKLISKVVLKRYSLVLACFILTINLYLGNFLKLPMTALNSSLSLYEKMYNFIAHKDKTFPQIFNAMQKLNTITKGGAYYLAIIRWERTGNAEQNYIVKAEYADVLKWDDDLKKVVDARPYMGNNGFHIPHDHNSSKSILNNDWAGGRGVYKDYKNYVQVAGSNVITMLGNYPFKAAKIAGATYNSGEDEVNRIRFVLVISEEASKNIDNTSEVVEIIENLRNDYIKAVEKSY
jgi:hypothetical protein